MKTPLIYSALMLLLWSGCAREELPYPVEMQQLPTDKTLTDVYFVDAQHGFASAGTIFTDGLLFETTDGGQTWFETEQFNQGLHSLSYYQQQLYIGETGQRLYQRQANIQQAHSTGGWWPWTEQVVLDNGDCLLVGGENFGRGFVHRYRASDNSFVLTDTLRHELQDIVQTPNGTLHAAGYGLVMRSTDRGVSWQISRLQGDFFRGIDFPSDQIGYVVGEYGSVYKTTDGGASWKNCRAGNSLLANPNKLLRDVAFVDAQTGFLVGTGSQVLRTTDGGKTWKKASNLESKTEYQKVELTGGAVYLLGHYGQLFRLAL